MIEKRKILVIEDTQENASLLRENLEKEGFEVKSSFDGKNGIRTALMEAPDLILCDVMMPEMSGYQVMSELKKNPGTATIPFIFLSGKADEMNIRKGMRLGADDYLRKPINNKELMEAIKVRLDKKDIYERNINNLRESISYSLPHELQTPLSAIIGFTDLLIDDYKTIDRDVLLDVAKNIKESSGRLNSLIQNILTLVKLDSLSKNKTNLRALRLHSTHITNEVIKETAIKKAKSAGRESCLEIDIVPANIIISKEHLNKLIEEVVDNSLKFSEQNSKIQITGYSYGSEYILYFRDHGRGMTGEQIHQVGEYMQFDRMMYERKGTELGLSIVKKILDLYCGELSIESIPFEQTLVSTKLLVS